MTDSLVPDMDVFELARKLGSGQDFILLDVREAWELERAVIADSRLRVASVSRLAELGARALPRAAQHNGTEILVLCHHGIRSAQVTRWLWSQGWRQVFNVRGGIDEYARRVDSSVGKY